MVTRAPVIDPSGRLWTSCHVVPDRWVLESNAGDTGGAYRWLLELVYGATDAAAYAAAEEAIAGTAPGERQIFCHLGPVVFNLADMSPFKPAGVLFRFPLLHVDRRRAARFCTPTWRASPTPSGATASRSRRSPAARSRSSR